MTAALVGAAVDVGAKLLSGSSADSRRQTRLQKDFARAQAGAAQGNTAYQDFLRYNAAHGNNVTQYEYDNIRRQAGDVDIAAPVTGAAMSAGLGAATSLLSTSGGGASGAGISSGTWALIIGGALFVVLIARGKR